MVVAIQRKADGYRRPAQLFGWRDCSYLVAEAGRTADWMSSRPQCLKVLESLLVVRLFAKSGECPGANRAMISLVVNEAKGDCVVYHVMSSEKDLNRIAEGDVQGVSSKDLVACVRERCMAGNPFPLYESGIEFAGLPRHHDVL